MMTMLIEAALRSALLGMVVASVLRLFRVRNPQIELTAWIVVLAASLAMPLLMQWTLVRLPAAPQLVPSAGNIVAHASRVLGPLPSVPVLAGHHIRLADLMSAGWDWVRASAWASLEVTYVAVALILLARLAAGLAMTWRIAGSAQPVRTLSTRDIDVRITDAVKGPVTFGRVILLPTAFVDWPSAKRRAVLCHERAHIEHHDFTVQLFGNLHVALFWFNPFAWWLQMTLASLAETTSDEAAITGVGNRIDYAEILLDIAVAARGLPAGIAMARPAMLRQRVERILTQAAPAITLAPRTRLVFALSLLPCVVLAGGTAWHAQAADISIAGTTDQGSGTMSSPSGPAYAILSGGHVMAASGGSDLEQLMRVRSRIGDQAILFMRDRKIYAITDPEQVGDAVELFGATDDLTEERREIARQQTDLNRQQAEIGRQQGDLERQMSELATQYSSEWAARVAEQVKAAAAEHADAVGDHPVVDTTKLKADIEQATADLKEQREELGRNQGELGAERGKLEAELSRLGREQSRMTAQGDAKLQSMIDHAMKTGTATLVP